MPFALYLVALITAYFFDVNSGICASWACQQKDVLAALGLTPQSSVLRGADRVPLKVRLGEWDTQSMKEFYPHEDYDVGNIYIHQYFRNSSLWNDIALLELTRPVSFAPHISPICLPKLEDVFEGSSCVVTGWGKDAYRELIFPVTERANKSNFYFQ